LNTNVYLILECNVISVFKYDCVNYKSLQKSLYIFIEFWRAYLSFTDDSLFFRGKSFQCNTFSQAHILTFPLLALIFQTTSWKRNSKVKTRAFLIVFSWLKIPFFTLETVNSFYRETTKLLYWPPSKIKELQLKF